MLLKRSPGLTDECWQSALLFEELNGSDDDNNDDGGIIDEMKAAEEKSEIPPNAPLEGDLQQEASREVEAEYPEAETSPAV